MENSDRHALLFFATKITLKHFLSLQIFYETDWKKSSKKDTGYLVSDIFYRWKKKKKVFILKHLNPGIFSRLLLFSQI